MDAARLDIWRSMSPRLPERGLAGKGNIVVDFLHVIAIVEHAQ
jgi:hypothetical protein